MGDIATSRLSEERKSIRKDHPPGFYAKPLKKSDNAIDLMNWEVGIPGKEGTDWEGGVYKVIMKFSSEYPAKPPLCSFSPPIFHPNVFSCGQICLSILKYEDGWRPAITIKQILLGIQELLDNPNPNSPANSEANNLFLRNKTEYSKRVKAQAKKYAPIS